MTSNLKRYISGLLLCSALAGCNVSQQLQVEKLKLPEHYATHSDTVNIARLTRNQFFTDTILVKLIEKAIANNYDSRIALQRIEQARASVIFTKGLLLPAVNAGGIAAVRRYGFYTMDGAGNATTDIEPGKLVPVNLPDYLVGMQSSWEVDITGKLRNRKKAAAARLLASIEGRQWLISNLVAEVATAYYELLSLDRELEIVRSSINLQENALEVVSIQKENRAANELMVAQFRAQLLNTKAMEFAVQQALTETTNQLNALLGRLPQPINRNSVSFEVNVSDSLKAGVPLMLLRNRPDIRQAELEVIASKADLQAARAAFYPSLNINASVGFQAYTSRLLFNNPESFMFTLVGGLSAPLLNRSAIKAEFNAVNAYQTETLYAYNQTTLNAYTEVYNELARMKNTSRALEYKQQEALELTRAIDVATELYRTGRANYLEVLIAQQASLEARLDLIYSKKQQFVNSIRLYKALGGGWD
jgi:outer membrane protein, multidrug efflux system